MTPTLANAEHQVTPDAGTALAIDRTRLAYERTLMAWIRTATSLISFGFTIYKFFELLHDKSGVTAPLPLFGSRPFGFVMVVLGLLALAFAVIQHGRNLRMLRLRYRAPVPRSGAALLAGMIAGLGILGLLAIAFHQ
jgi:putative membrane protein